MTLREASGVTGIGAREIQRRLRVIRLEKFRTSPRRFGFLSLTEAAWLLCCDPSGVRDLMHNGTLDAFREELRDRWRWRIPADQVWMVAEWQVEKGARRPERVA